MLSPQSWLHLTNGLLPGRRKRVNHDCGPGSTLLLSRDADGFRAFCFRCNDGATAPNPQESLADKVARLSRFAEAEKACNVLRSLPEPKVADVSAWPKKAALWLYKAGIGRAEIGRLGAYYHPPTDRVVLPILENGESIFWQARALDGRQPKYMAPAVDRTKVLPVFGASRIPTLTEDILSAFKVGLVGEGWAVMGTKLSAYGIGKLMERGSGCNVWFDNDLPPVFQVNRGQIAARKLIKQLRAYNIPVRNIVSAKDPKLHTRDEIRNYLDLPILQRPAQFVTVQVLDSDKG